MSIILWRVILERKKVTMSVHTSFLIFISALCEYFYIENVDMGVLYNYEQYQIVLQKFTWPTYEHFDGQSSHHNVMDILENSEITEYMVTCY